ncbi:hypothetical protein QEZ54_20120 [Catellatospora sp. KI3]|uniref:hypothetical protein n=1 Tax=Catellatospora sp. KI3 TaxID=3041620 RepID=UPI002482C84B|nr:hypothetical protein [Catellatospora sp. KI3]MDI1463293.1 hypothetical protein [Catellatospora sp. KI3]
MTTTGQLPVRSRSDATQRLRVLGVESSGSALRVIADGDLVVVQARFTGYGDAPDFIGFEIIRLAGARTAERWVALQPSTDTVGSCAPDQPEHPEQTKLSRRLVDYYTDHVLIGGELSNVSHFVVTDLIQHTAALGSGVAPMCAALSNRLMCYRRRHLTVAEGEFVFVVCTGGVHDEPAAFYDLYRLDRAMIVEHWSVITPMPDRLPGSPVGLGAAGR